MFTLMGNCVCSLTLTPDLSFFFKHPPPLVKSPADQRSSFSVCYTTKSKNRYSLKTHFEPPDSSSSIITFFKQYGFSDSHVSKIIKKYPFLLRCSFEDTFKLKFDFFKSHGISGSDLADIVCQNPEVLKASLDKKIIPCVEFMKSIVKTDAKLIALLKSSLRVLMKDPQKNLIPNVVILQQHGVPVDNIEKLLSTVPSLYLRPTSRFLESVEEAKEMGFDPCHYIFLVAVYGLSSMSTTELKTKFDVFRKLGFSKDEVQCMLQKSPICLLLTEKNITSTMNFLVNEMGYTPSFIAKYPKALEYSLERRIIPRCSVIQILKTMGLVRNVRTLSTFLRITEEKFLRKFVIKFEKQVPELLTIYKGKVKEGKMNVSVTKPTTFDPSSNADSVIAFFQNNKLSDSQISKIIRYHPNLLRYNVKNILEPKLEFFKSQGICGSDLAKVLFQDPSLLVSSLEKNIIPNFELLRSIVQPHAKLLVLLKRSPRVLIQDPQREVIPNMALLRAQGVPADYILKFLVSRTKVFLNTTSRIAEVVEEAKKMKFNPSEFKFLTAVHALASLSRSSLEAKFDIYRRWGLSEDEVQFMFRKKPNCVLVSEKKIMSVLNYFVKEMGYTPCFIVNYSFVLLTNLEGRIIPRCSVIQILETKGLIGKYSISTYLKMTDEAFMEKFVTKFEEDPEVLTAYKVKQR